ncbi:hypothetical protein ABIB25_003294 [Nakamurella sp. UYEF19]|uniref:amidohydrolase family protein n=1 Tax=Nakamurella sp. UYEF19 TaxID=1756392 RepID=UPI00339A88F8
MSGADSLIHPPGTIDVHQHLWPPALIDALRSFTGPLRLDGWTLHLPGEPPYEVSPAHHDLETRVAQETGSAAALVSLSSPLGIENMAPEIAGPLLTAWHDGAAELPPPFHAWAAVHSSDPNLQDLETRLTAGFIGLQIPATSMTNPRDVERLAPVLRLCELADKPVLIHPGPVPVHSTSGTLPSWWPAVVDYTAQMTASWWSWAVAGRSLLPALRICFAAGAGLAPVHHERFSVRGGGNPPPIDKLSFVETSSYGPRGLDALIRVLGIDVVVNGTDRPYATTSELRLGDAADRAVRVVNPRRLLGEPTAF